MTMKKNLPSKKRLSQAKILVVGDVMLDRYWFGDVTRISPEAPVPVAKIMRGEERAGGAANVARNIACMSGQSTLLSVVGNDEAAFTLENLLKKDGVTVSFLRDRHSETTVKLRVIARQQQLLRLDFESMPRHEILAGKLDEFKKCLPEHDLVILSDYGKGGLTHVKQMIAAARAADKKVLIDPKGNDWSGYAGATLLTPNKAEFRQVAGDWQSEDELEQLARALIEKLALEAILLTRSEEGMSLFTAKQTWHEATLAREVFDVSGAGDTVIATLGLMLAADLPLEAAIKVANTAAGIVVGKLGTATASLKELRDAAPFAGEKA